VVTALATAALAGCGGGSDSGPLKALEADPMATYLPAGTTLVRSDGTPQRTGGGLDKPSPATLRRLLQLPAGAGTEAVTAAARHARAVGWSVDPAPAGAGVTGRRSLGGGAATLTLTLVTDAALVPGGRPPALSVALEQVR